MTADVWTAPERLALRESAAGFVRRSVLPHLAAWEAAGEVPREVHRTAARTFTRSVVVRHVAGEDVAADACLATNAAVAAGGCVVDQAVQLHGGTGYLRESDVERHYRDVRILGSGGGATEVLADLAGRLLGHTIAPPPARSAR